MLPFLCCLFASFVGHTLAVGTEDVIDCETYPDTPACKNRASWGYLASNGPVGNHFVLLMKLTRFLSQATWAANYGSAQGGYCDGMSQSPINLDDSVAVMNDPGEITMVRKVTDNMAFLNISFKSRLDTTWLRLVRSQTTGTHWCSLIQAEQPPTSWEAGCLKERGWKLTLILGYSWFLKDLSHVWTI